MTRIGTQVDAVETPTERDQVVDIAPRGPAPPPEVSWANAPARALEAKRSREAIIEEVLVEGQHYGKLDGIDKPCLYKPGAEAIADALDCFPEFELLTGVEDFDAGLFHYRYACRLRLRYRPEVVVSSGIGSCNSHEVKYRYRRGSPVCPVCGQENLRRSKLPGQEGGYYCWTKTGGCGTEFLNGDSRLENTNLDAGRVENEDPADQVNTIDKMAQKRALVAAALLFGFSSHFTQDLEGTLPTESDGNSRERNSASSAARQRAPDPEPEREMLEPEEYPHDEGFALDNPYRPTVYYQGTIAIWDVGKLKGTSLVEFEDGQLQKFSDWCQGGDRLRNPKLATHYELAQNELIRRHAADQWERDNDVSVERGPERDESYPDEPNDEHGTPKD